MTDLKVWEGIVSGNLYFLLNPKMSEEEVILVLKKIKDTKDTVKKGIVQAAFYKEINIIYLWGVSRLQLKELRKIGSILEVVQCNSCSPSIMELISKYAQPQNHHGAGSTNVDEGFDETLAKFLDEISEVFPEKIISKAPPRYLTVIPI